MAQHYIYLVPGFFGFSNLGGITYFHHVREALEERFSERGHDVQIVAVSTFPTGSVRDRAAQLADQIAATAGDKGPIHLIGHSTGGLDTRMFTTPNASLPTDVELEPLARRVRSVVTVATPHMGTPIAQIFNNVFGQRLLSALSLATVYTLRFGRLPLRALFELIGLVTRVDRLLGQENTILEQFYRELFSDFEGERADEISEFVSHIRNDRDIIVQLTPGAIDIFNGSASDRRTARYGSVITRAAGISLKATASIKFDIYSHASHTVFRLLQGLTARKSHYFDMKPDHESMLIDGYGDMPSSRSNDGVVPTLSQIWGEIIHVARADHLDVCGHFRDPDHDPPHIDWFVSGSGFRRTHFDALWSDVTAFMLDR